MRHFLFGIEGISAYDLFTFPFLYCSVRGGESRYIGSVYRCGTKPHILYIRYMYGSVATVQFRRKINS